MSFQPLVNLLGRFLGCPGLPSGVSLAAPLAGMAGRQRPRGRPPTSQGSGLRCRVEAWPVLGGLAQGRAGAAD